MAESADPNELPPLAGRPLIIAAVALSLGTFMNVLDTTIANVSIPAISGDVGVAPNQGTWVITSFAVSNAIGVPLTGWLAQRFGSVRLFLSSVLLFAAASLCCALSSTLPILITFRVVQGMVAGPMIPISMALLLQSFPRKQAGIAMATWSMTTLVAPVVGPILGGWLTDNLSWPWIFYINVPVGLGAAWAAQRVLRGRESPTRRVPIDFVGLTLLVLWVGAFQIMLDKGRELDWFNSSAILALAAVAAVGLCFFVAWELTEQHPIVDLSFFRRRSFTVGAIAFALGYGIFFGNLVLLPLWLQQFMGYTATWAGLALAPVGVLAIFLTPLVGKYLARIDPRIFASIAFLAFSIASFMRSGFSTDVDLATIAVAQIAQGVAVATFFVSMTAITLSGLPQRQVPPASGLANFMRITAGAFGASIVTTAWDNRASLHHVQLAERINAYSQPTQAAMQGISRLGLNAQQQLGLIESQINTQAYMMSADDLFWMSGILTLLLIPVVFLARPSKSPA